MRVTGRFLGFCLAATLAPAALCAVPANGSGPATRFMPTLNSDMPPPSTVLGTQHALRQRGIRVDEAEVDPRECDGQATGRPAMTLSAVSKAADLQGPLTRRGSRVGDDTASPSGADRVLGDGVHRALGARSAVLDSDRTVIGESQPQPADTIQTRGLKVRSLNDHERALYGVPEGGLMVTAVGQGAGQQAGLRQGDVVLMLDGISLSDAAQFYRLIHQLPHDRPVPVLVRRSTSDLFLPLGSVRH